MPGFITSKKKEKDWSAAKAAANKTHSEPEGNSYWAIVNSIYQTMQKNDLNKAKLSDEQDDENDGNEDLDGMSILDDEEGQGDEADKWLKEQEAKQTNPQESPEDVETSTKEVEPENKPKRSTGYTDWKPREDYSPEEQRAIDHHISQGYSHREAERMAGAHRGPSDFQSALKHTVRPSAPSNKMLEDLRGPASEWISNARRYEQQNADIEKNPVKYATGKIVQAHEEAHKDFDNDYAKFLASPEIQNLKGKARFDAVNNFKKQWKEKNPEHEQKKMETSIAAQSSAQDAAETQRKTFQEKLHHIMSGGISDPTKTMSAEEAGQHIGAAKEGDEGPHRSTTIKDPLAHFAHENPKLLSVLKEHAKPEQMERFNRVNSAKAAVASSSPNVIIRRKKE